MINLTPDIEIRDLALYVKKEKALIISDLQLGYEKNMIEEGFLIPLYQFKDLVDRLKKILEGLEIEKIIINGDMKHEFGKISHQEWDNVLGIIDFLLKYCKKLIIIRGNHDIVLNSITKKRNIEILDDYQLGKIFITHGHKIPEIPKGINTILIGHAHPAITLSEGDVKETYKCFLKGRYKTKTLIVQPSSFLLNEGSDVLSYEPNSPFISKRGFKNFEVWAIADKIFYFSKLKDLEELFKKD